MRTNINQGWNRVNHKYQPKMTIFQDRLTLLVKRERSKRAFAQKCGISPQLLDKYLSGSVPGLQKMRTIASACGVSVEWLDGSENDNSSCFVTTGQTTDEKNTSATGVEDEAAATRAAIAQLSALIDAGIEFRDWHAVGLVRRDIEALLSEIRRLYPNLARRVSSAKNGVA